MIKVVNDLQNLEGKKVMVRVDFNVPLKDGAIRDDNRIVQALPTIKYLIAANAKVILLSHLGKVDHKKSEDEIAIAKKKGDLKPVATRLSELLGLKVSFSSVTRGEALEKLIDKMKNGGVLLIQNTRYEKGEEKNDKELSSYWAKLADAYVMDAFGSAHRAHSSTYGIPECLKKANKEVAMGYLVEKEVRSLNSCVDNNTVARPYVAILGGFKVSDKIKVIDALLSKCDKILIGGAMAYTFAKALGRGIGNSPCEEDQLEYAATCMEKAKGRILLPLDAIAADDFANPTTILTTLDPNIPEGFEGMDVGPKTRALYTEEIKKARTIFWNGPMGVFEKESFTRGTIAICDAVKNNTLNAFSVIGGGDSAAAAKEFGYMEAFSHVSTGGGASLEMIENNGHLPGIDVLEVIE